MAIISAQQVCYAYPTADGPLPILKDLDLSIDVGEFVAIQGPSGSGKSTLLHLLGCMQQADSGRLLIEGQDVSELSKTQLAYLRNQKLGFVFQNFQFLNKLTVLENILLPTQYPVESQQTSSADQQKALELAAYLGLEDRLHYYPNALSRGQQQRVAIARALIRGSRILLADEPTGNLDSQSTRRILQLFKQLNQEQGITIIMITHDAEVAAVTDKVYYFNDGRIEKSTENTQANSLGTTQKLPPLVNPPEQPSASPFWLMKLFPLAVKNIWSYKVRSMLTMLGIVIGIAAVLAMSTLGNFTKEKVLDSYATLGVNTLVIQGHPNWQLSATDRFPVKYNFFDLKYDLDPLLRLFPEVRNISPILYAWRSEVSYGGRRVSKGSNILGVNEHYLAITQRRLLAGNNFSQYHIANEHNVCILGFNMAEQLFINTDPLGKMVQVKQDDNYLNCKVIGVLEYVRSNEEALDQNLWLILPYTSFRNVMPYRRLQHFIVELAPRSDIEQVGNAIKGYFSEKYGVSGDFNIGADGALLQQMQNFLSLFSLLLIIMSMISLTVGGIGISNMMLVSVSERIKEIGLHKALGATDRSVRMQFLIEALILCCLAGITGLILGFICYQSVIYGAAQFFEALSYEWVFNISAMVLSVASMIIVGVISGLLPAFKAESLQIVEALRQD